MGDGTGRGRRPAASWRRRTGRSIDVGAREPGHDCRGVTVTGGRPDSAASDVTVTKRDGCDGAGLGATAGHIAAMAVALAMAERVPWAGGTDRLQRNPHTPLYQSRAGTPYASRPQPDQIYRDRNSLPAERVKYPHLRNGPLRLDRQVPTQNL
jgi:hypothetical protein